MPRADENKTKGNTKDFIIVAVTVINASIIGLKTAVEASPPAAERRQHRRHQGKHEGGHIIYGFLPVIMAVDNESAAMAIKAKRHTAYANYSFPGARAS